MVLLPHIPVTDVSLRRPESGLTTRSLISFPFAFSFTSSESNLCNSDKKLTTRILFQHVNAWTTELLKHSPILSLREKRILSFRKVGSTSNGASLVISFSQLTHSLARSDILRLIDQRKGTDSSITNNSYKD